MLILWKCDYLPAVDCTEFKTYKQSVTANEDRQNLQTSIFGSGLIKAILL